MAAVRRLTTNVPDEENQRIVSKPMVTRGLKPRTALSNIANVASKQPNLKQGKTLQGKKPAITKTKSAVDVQKLQDTVKGDTQTDKKSSKQDGKNIMDMELDALALLVEVPETTGIEDIDADDYLNPQLCAEYVKDVYKYLHRLEKKFQVPDYLHKQPEINERMRSILIDWLIQVHSRFGLLQETLYLSVYLIDRFLAVETASRSKLQLVGVSAMLLASKYEETYAPEVADFVYITDNAYTSKQIRQMEQLIFKTIDFDLSHPLCLHFLRRNSKAAMADAKKHTLAKYFMELTLIDYETARALPSLIASAALCLSIKLIDKLDKLEWNKTLEHYSTYSGEDLKPYVSKIARLVLKTETSKNQAVKSKYSSSKFMKVSTLSELTGDNIRKTAEMS